MKTIRLSLRSARWLLSVRQELEWADGSPAPRVFAELKAAIARLGSTKKVATRRMKRLKKFVTALEKRTARQEVRALVMTRADGRCEACAFAFTALNPAELEHFFGKARGESLEACWALCKRCHREKTDSVPSARQWATWFIEHQKQHGYDTTQARRVFHRANDKAALDEGRKGLAS